MEQHPDEHQSRVEEILAVLTALYCEVREVDRVDPEGDLFAQGLDSLDGLRLANLVEDRLGAAVDLELFLLEPSLRAIASQLGSDLRVRVDASRRHRDGQPAEIPLGSRRRRARLGCLRPAPLPTQGRVSRKELGALLDPLRQRPGPGGTLGRRAYPSAGCRYAVGVELVVPAHTVAGLGPGAYGYDPIAHALRFKAGTGRAIADLTMIFVADLAATGGRAYEDCLLEAGAIVQLVMTECPRTLAAVVLPHPAAPPGPDSAVLDGAVLPWAVVLRRAGETATGTLAGAGDSPEWEEPEWEEIVL